MSSSIAGVVLYSVALVARAPELATPPAPTAVPSGPVHLIKDVNATPDVRGRGSRFEDMIRVGDLAYVRTFTPSTGTEIWRTDGTPGGTFIPAEIPGLVGTPEVWWESAGILYYSVRTGEGFNDLWRSDGTKSGTRKVKRFAVGQYVYHALALHQEQSLFQVYDVYAETFHLWRTDGTEAGTVFVTAMSYFLGDGVWLHGAAYLPDAYGLRKTDGTAAGTGSVPGVCGVDTLVKMNGKLYFSGRDCQSNPGLYRSDGTEAGTELVMGFENGLSGLTVVGDVLYFSATYGSELWKSDGSSEGTVRVQYVTRPTDFVEAGGVVLFSANDEHGQELWKTDGTAEGTTLVKDIRPGSRNSDIRSMFAAGGAAYFTASDGVHGNELWRSDGTTAGTVLLKDIYPGSQGQPFIRNMVDLGGTVLFPAADPIFGWEVWKTDGTGSGTVLLKDMNPVAATSNSIVAWETVRIGRTLYFGADDGLHGDGLWKTDGTPAGTTLVQSFAGFVQLWTEQDGRIVFQAFDGAHGYEVWKSDGTEAGTVPVTDFDPAIGAGPPLFVGILDGAVYFTASDGGPRSLWKTDLTETGPVLVHEGLESCGDFRVVSGVLYLAGDDGVHGCELWKVEAVTGAQMVKNVRPDDQTLYPPVSFVEANGKLLFIMDDGVHGLEPWTSDGTEEGTNLVKDVNPGENWSVVSDGLIPSGGKFYFPGDDGVNGTEIWVTDGTEEGTRLFADLLPGPDSLYPGHLVDVGGRLIFQSLQPGYEANELWSTDGTEAGTQVIQEGVRVYDTPTAIDGVALVASDNPGADYGFGLWRSDGTAGGTAPVQVIDRFSYASDNGQSNLTGFTKVGHRIIFFADDGVTGLEPWTGWAAVLENRPAQGIADLRDEVSALNLPSNASSSLMTSLAKAARALHAGDAYAIPWLDAFAQQVNAETPQWIAPEAGAELVDFAQGIIGLLQPRPEPPIE